LVEFQGDAPDLDSGRAMLSQSMPDIETILTSGGTSPLDYTLHDSGHSFRVAEQMARIIGPSLLPNLSHYEVSLLLLAAYLHDIGMTPEQKKVFSHYSYLVSGNASDLNQKEIAGFQKWLDEEGRGIAPPISKGTYAADALHLASELITYYSRFRHNDWSEEWIRKNLATQKLGTYAGWLDDLVVLCRSHHYGYEELVKERFNPRLVGSPVHVVHLRYLAAVLRVADVLEFDPERTPLVILRHRDVSPESVIYWWKDKEISFAMEGNRIILSARPENAYVHRAIEETVDQIDQELRLCRTLADSTHFEKCPGLVNDLEHHWRLSPSVHRDIQPRSNSYVYIDGAFRPDTEKLLHILSGIELYGNPLVAVRELIQNAFDAVREQIAYERLSQPRPADPSWESKLGQLHSVDMRFELDSSGAWLVCADSGIGMTMPIIRDHLLISGAARRHDVLSLERRCREAGFPLGRTGEFGIGVLSYFMIADHVEIRTRRSQSPGDGEPNGWHFETEGIGSFGELRREDSIQRGTEVRLHISPEALGPDPGRWFASLLQYVNGILMRVPCRFRLSSTMPECESINLGAGWGWDETQMSRLVVTRPTRYRNQEGEVPPELLSIARREKIEAQDLHWAQVIAEARSCLHFLTKEGELPGKLGLFRIHVPYFDLPGGRSLIFLRARDSGGELTVDKIEMGYCYIPSLPAYSAWKGIRLTPGRYSAMSPELYSSMHQFSKLAIVEVDWTDPEAGRIPVSREELDPRASGIQALEWLRQQCIDLIRTFIAHHSGSVYDWLNYRKVGSESPVQASPHWLFVDGSDGYQKAFWRQLRYPFITALAFPYRRDQPSQLRLKGKPVTVVRCLGESRDGATYEGLSWNSHNLPPTKIVAIYPGRHFLYWFQVAALWTADSSKAGATHVAGMTCLFPPKWSHICGVKFGYYSGLHEPCVVWNPKHPLLRLVDAAAWDWCREQFNSSLDPLPHKGGLLLHRGRAAAWILLCLRQEKYDLWEGLNDRDDNFLGDLWKLVFGIKGRPGKRFFPPLYEWVEESSDSQLRILSPNGWTTNKREPGRNLAEIEKYFPNPGPNWCLGESS